MQDTCQWAIIALDEPLFGSPREGVARQSLAMSPSAKADKSLPAESSSPSVAHQARKNGDQLLEGDFPVGGEVPRAILAHDAGNHAVCEGPVSSRGIVHAIADPAISISFLAVLGVVGRVLVGASVAPEDRGELAAREGVANAESVVPAYPVMRPRAATKVTASPYQSE